MLMGLHQANNYRSIRTGIIELLARKLELPSSNDCYHIFVSGKLESVPFGVVIVLAAT